MFSIGATSGDKDEHSRTETSGFPGKLAVRFSVLSKTIENRISFLFGFVLYCDYAPIPHKPRIQQIATNL